MGFVTKTICDRCEEEFTGSVYTIDIQVEDLDPPARGSIFPALSSEVASFNIQRALVGKKIYCRKCIEFLREQFKL